MTARNSRSPPKSIRNLPRWCDPGNININDSEIDQQLKNPVSSQQTNDDVFVKNIKHNTQRYVECFETAADDLLPVPSVRRYENDIYDVLHVCGFTDASYMFMVFYKLLMCRPNAQHNCNQERVKVPITSIFQRVWQEDLRCPSSQRYMSDRGNFVKSKPEVRTINSIHL